LPALRGSGISETMEICPSATYASCDHIKTCDSSTQVSGWLSMVSRTGQHVSQEQRCSAMKHVPEGHGC
jgi:hypothetical protein